MRVGPGPPGGPRGGLRSQGVRAPGNPELRHDGGPSPRGRRGLDVRGGLRGDTRGARGLGWRTVGEEGDAGEGRTQCHPRCTATGPQDARTPSPRLESPPGKPSLLLRPESTCSCSQAEGRGRGAHSWGAPAQISPHPAGQEPHFHSRRSVTRVAEVPQFCNCNRKRVSPRGSRLKSLECVHRAGDTGTQGWGHWHAAPELPGELFLE